VTIILNHTIVPAREKLAAARFFASIFGLNFNERESDHFAPVRVNETRPFSLTRIPHSTVTTMLSM
jgi:hypothetical protein